MMMMANSYPSGPAHDAPTVVQVYRLTMTHLTD
jgi:hypothetical protein